MDFSASFSSTRWACESSNTCSSGLILRSDRIVQERRLGLFDMAAENVRYRLVARKIHQALDAGCERGKIEDIEPARIKRVAGQQDAGPAIVERDAKRLMARNRNHVQHAPAEVNRAMIGWPVANAVSLCGSFHRQRNHGYIWLSDKLLVTGDMIVVAVRMRHNQRDRLAAIPPAPLRDGLIYNLGDVGLSRPRYPEAARGRGRRKDTGTAFRNWCSPIRAGCKNPDCKRAPATSARPSNPGRR